jgi:hypothetical protein
MLTITGNLALDDAATGTQTGTVGEPSIAVSSAGYFVTGNWYATRSADRGASWTLLDPFSSFPTDRGEFSCDQVATYVPGMRLWVWLLQYSKSGSSNIYRLAASRTAAPGTWHWWDVSAADLDPSWTNVWFDFPDLQLSEKNLWISFNVYDQNDRWVRAGVLRYPLSGLAKTDPLPRRAWPTTAVGSLRLVAGAGSSMWFAGTDQARRSLRVFEWPDDSPDVTAFTVPVTAWNDTDYTSNGPDGSPWLSRCDDRVTGAWRAGGRLGFLWSAGRSPGRPQPFIRAVTLDEQSLDVVGEPDLWSANGAWAYPAAAPNRRGDVGLTAFYGGAVQPAHAVGILDQQANSWTTKLTATSTHAPLQGKWGDYLTCRAHPSRRTSWVASGYTLQGGQDRRNIEPRVVTFRA